MGIILSDLHLLALEQKEHPIKGDVLTLGQQAVFASLEEVKEIFVSHGLSIKSLKENFDTKSKLPGYVGTPRGNFTNAQTVFALLGAGRVFASDVSDYEKSDYIIDLNNKVNQEFYEKFDVILDSGTLEHVFDTPTALENVVRMLKKGGRAIFILPSSGAIDHGFYSFSPTFFFDFFKANGFSDFSCYLMEENGFNIYQKSKVYKYKYNNPGDCPLPLKKNVQIFFSAQKNEDCREIKKPIQGMYLVNNWGKERKGEATFEPSNFEKLKRKVEFVTRKFRPEIVDALWKTKKRMKNLTYLGKF
jgi:SAM-dependent methyltransferase